MRQLLSRLLVVALLLVACSGAVWGDGLKVTITKKGGGTEIKTGQASLAMAFKGLALKEVEGIGVSTGNFTEADWSWLKANRYSLTGLKKFVVTDGVESVADIPETDWLVPYFGNALEELRVAKLNKVGGAAISFCSSLRSVSLPCATEIGSFGFYSCAKLQLVSLPAVTKIGDEAFYGCSGLKKLQLGATPPSNLGVMPFAGCPLAHELELIKPDGTPLTGNDLDNAKSRYKDVNDGDTGDNLWYGWAFEEFPASNLSGTIDGVPFTNKASLEAAMQGKVLKNVKKLTITGGTFQVSDWGFLLEQGQHELAIEKFTIASSVDRVADLPDLSGESPYLPSAQIVRIERVQKVGTFAFYGCTSLTSVSLPAATDIGAYAFDGCTSLTSVSLPSATEIGSYGFYGCAKIQRVSLPSTTNIGYHTFEQCVKLKTLQLGATPPTSVGGDAFTNCPAERTLIITDAMGVPLVGTELESAAAKYDRNEGSPNDGKWYGWTIETNPPTMLSVIVTPTGAGTAKITRKASGAVVNEGETLTKDEVLVIDAKPNDEHQYKLKEVTAKGATNTLGNEWKVTAEPGAQVVFTVEFKAKGGAAPTLGTPIITPTGAGTAIITRKASGAVVNVGDALTKDEVLIVKGEPDGTHEVKEITATGATNTSGIEWKVDIASGKVTFTVQFKAKGGAAPTLGTPIITPAGAGTAKITRKASGAVVNVGDELTKDEVLVITVKPKDKHLYKLKEVAAKGADKAGKNEWKVTAAPGEQVVFTVVFEKKPEEEGGNNSNNDPTPVESVLLAQAQLSPNPTNGQVTIDAGTTLARCEVYSSMGALLQAIESPESVFTIDLTASPSGVYLVRLVDMHGGCKTLRVVKQ